MSDLSIILVVMALFLLLASKTALACGCAGGGNENTTTIASCSGDSGDSSGGIGMANPAAVYCSELGYEYRKVKTETGGTSGICVFSSEKGDDSCDAWAFLEGKCGVEHSYCSSLGYGLEVKSDGRNMFSKDYAVCVVQKEETRELLPASDATERIAVTDLFNLSQKVSHGIIIDEPKGNANVTMRAMSSLSASGIGEEIRTPSDFLTYIENRNLPEYASSFTKSIGKNENKSEEELAATQPTGLFEETLKKQQPSLLKNGFKPTRKNESIPLTVEPSTLPTNFDWRDKDGKNWITPIRDQAQCGSCWAFGAIAGVEAKYNIERNDSAFDVDLAEEYLVSSCCETCGNGCSGGWPDQALEYVRDYGVSDEACFTYTAEDAYCSDRCSTWNHRLWRINDYGSVSRTYDADLIKEYLIEKGPLPTTMYMYWDDYFDDNGVYHCPDETDLRGGHAILLVGYNDTGNYWILKNSWGADWNGDGYFNVAYGECNLHKSYGAPFYVDISLDDLKSAQAGSMLTSQGTENGSLNRTYAKDGSYLVISAACSGGNCTGLNVAFNFSGANVSETTGSAYVLAYHNATSEDNNISVQFLNDSTKQWETIGSVPYSYGSLMKYEVCQSRHECQNYLSKNFSARYFAPSCTSCEADAAYIDWLALESIPEVGYCTAEGTNQSQGYITHVTLNGSHPKSVNEKTSNDSSYSDFTNEFLMASLANGSTYTLNVTVTRNDTAGLVFVKAWIDYDGDMNFSASEAIDVGNATFSGTHTFTKNFTVPANANIALTRMRIFVKYNATPNSSCEYADFGEVEDYAVKISRDNPVTCSCGIVSEDCTLTEDINATDDCISIGDDYVTLDCAGHSIISESGSGESSGGIIVSSRQGVTVRNCNISGFTYGIESIKSKNNAFTSNNVSECEYGIAMEDENGSTVSSNRFYETTGGVIVLGSNNTISGNTIRYAEDGIGLEGSNDNLVSGNNISDAYSAGIVLLMSENDNVTGNNVSYGSEAGIIVMFADNLDISQNRMNNNELIGMEIFLGLNNRFSENTASGSEIGFAMLIGGGNWWDDNNVSYNAYGLVFAGAVNENLTGNVMDSDSNTSLYVEGDECDYYNHSIDSSNTKDGLPIRYYFDSNSTVLNSSSTPTNGPIIIACSDNFTVRNYKIENDSIILFETPDSTVINNSVSGGAYGIVSSYSNNTKLLGNNISSATEGIIVMDSNGTNVSWNRVTDNEDDGIELSDSANAYLAFNNASRNGNYGIGVSDTENATLLHNLIDSNGDDGIYIYYSEHATLKENEMEGNVGSSIDIAGSVCKYYNQSIDGSNTKDGLPVRYYFGSSDVVLEPSGKPTNGPIIIACSDNFTVKNYEIQDDTILLFNTSASMVENNTITSTYYGVRLEYSEENTIRSNDFINDTYAIYLHASDDNAILSNNVSDGNNGIYVYSSDGNNMSWNHAESMAGAGIFVYSSYNSTLVSNEISDAHIGLELAYADDNDLRSNRISGSDYGIWSYESYSNTVTSNAVSGSSDCGIYLDYSENYVLSGNSIDENNGTAISVYGYDCDQYNHSIDSSNTVDGSPVRYYFDSNDFVLDASARPSNGPIIIACSDNVTVRNYELSDDSIYFYDTSNSLIEKNIIAPTSSGYGIDLDDSSNNIIDDCTFISPETENLAWFSGTGNNLYTWMNMTFDLSGVSSANLSFVHSYYIESGYDGGRIEFYDNTSGEWGPLYPTIGSYNCDDLDEFDNGYAYCGESDGWEPASFNLTPFCGGRVNIRFVYRTDISVMYAGWFIDNITISSIGFFDDAESGNVGWNVSGFSIGNPDVTVYGVDFDRGSSDNTVRNSQFSGNSVDAVLRDYAYNNTLLNVTSFIDSEPRSPEILVYSTAAYCWLKQYARVNVTDSTGNPINGALVTVYDDNSNAELEAEPTSATGLTSWFVATEAVLDYWGRNESTPHNVTADAGVLGWNYTTVYINQSTIVHLVVGDSEPPEVHIFTPVSGETYETTGLAIDYYAYDAHSGVDSVWYEYNGENISLEYNETYFLAAEGNSTLILWANDSAGNIAHDSMTFTAVQEWPAVLLYSPQNKTYETTEIPLSYYAYDSDGVINVWYEYNGSSVHIIDGKGAAVPIGGDASLPEYLNSTIKKSELPFLFDGKIYDDNGNNYSANEKITLASGIMPFFDTDDSGRDIKVQVPNGDLNYVLSITDSIPVLTSLNKIHIPILGVNYTLIDWGNGTGPNASDGVFLKFERGVTRLLSRGDSTVYGNYTVKLEDVDTSTATARVNVSVTGAGCNESKLISQASPTDQPIESFCSGNLQVQLMSTISDAAELSIGEQVTTTVMDGDSEWFGNNDYSVAIVFNGANRDQPELTISYEAQTELTGTDALKVGEDSIDFLYDAFEFAPTKMTAKEHTNFNFSKANSKICDLTGADDLSPASHGVIRIAWPSDAGIDMRVAGRELGFLDYTDSATTSSDTSAQELYLGYLDNQNISVTYKDSFGSIKCAGIYNLTVNKTLKEVTVVGAARYGDAVYQLVLNENATNGSWDGNIEFRSSMFEDAFSNGWNAIDAVTHNDGVDFDGIYSTKGTAAASDIVLHIVSADGVYGDLTQIGNEEKDYIEGFGIAVKIPKTNLESSTGSMKLSVPDTWDKAVLIIRKDYDVTSIADVVTDSPSTLSIFADDTDGNTGSASVTFNARHMPEIVLLSPQNTTYTTQSIPLQFWASEDLSWTAYSLDAGANVTLTDNTSINPENGFHSIIVYGNDSAGNYGKSNVTYFYKNYHSRSSGGSSTEGGGGGGAGSVASSTNAPETMLFTSADAGVEVEFKPTRWTNVTNVTLTLGNKVTSSFRISVQQLAANATNATVEPDGVVYAYLKISVTGVDTEDVKAASFSFKIAKPWMTSNDVTPEGIRIERYNEATKAWEDVPVELLKEDSAYYYFKATPNHFSIFAITALITEESTTVETTNETETTPVCGDLKCDSAESCSTCPSDCGACTLVCGDLKCDSRLGEDCSLCPSDCGICPAVCGDRVCEKDKGETAESCARDCLIGGQMTGSNAYIWFIVGILLIFGACSSGLYYYAGRRSHESAARTASAYYRKPEHYYSWYGTASKDATAPKGPARREEMGEEGILKPPQL